MILRRSGSLSITQTHTVNDISLQFDFLHFSLALRHSPPFCHVIYKHFNDCYATLWLRLRVVRFDYHRYNEYTIVRCWIRFSVALFRSIPKSEGPFNHYDSIFPRPGQCGCLCKNKRVRLVGCFVSRYENVTPNRLGIPVTCSQLAKSNQYFWLKLR